MIQTESFSIKHLDVVARGTLMFFHAVALSRGVEWEGVKTADSIP